jgi:hypothetical protein
LSLRAKSKATSSAGPRSQFGPRQPIDALWCRRETRGAPALRPHLFSVGTAGPQRALCGLLSLAAPAACREWRSCLALQGNWLGPGLPTAYWSPTVSVTHVLVLMAIRSHIRIKPRTGHAIGPRSAQGNNPMPPANLLKHIPIFNLRRGPRAPCRFPLDSHTIRIYGPSWRPSRGWMFLRSPSSC